MDRGDLVAGRYRMVRPVAEGGAASVWVAHHEAIDRYVAVKVTKPQEATGQEEVRERLRAEARAIGRLHHPNIVDVLDYGELDDGRRYIVLELLDGMTLWAHLGEVGKLPPRTAVHVAVQLCHGLEAAHSAGVVHRDIKPENVFLHRIPTGGTLVKLLDFGIARSQDEGGVCMRLTHAGKIIGTPYYMSVEQGEGREDVDARADVWGMGVLLYEMVAGKVPFDGPTYNAVIFKVFAEDPPRLSEHGVEVPAELEAAIFRCLAKKREERFASARELRDALEAVLPALPETVDADLAEAGAPLALPSLIPRGPLASSTALEVPGETDRPPAGRRQQPTTQPDVVPRRRRLVVGVVAAAAIAAGGAWAVSGPLSRANARAAAAIGALRTPDPAGLAGLAPATTAPAGADTAAGGPAASVAPSTSVAAVDSAAPSRPAAPGRRPAAKPPPAGSGPLKTRVTKPGF